MIILTAGTQGFGIQHLGVGRQTVFVAVAVDSQILFRLGNGVFCHHDTLAGFLYIQPGLADL